ncbi:hypothetical protein BS78_04G010200 [Paspalum vaginatum]|nr:hypothetical protein BS78_04G010200 [Paspalum vaginatum]
MHHRRSPSTTTVKAAPAAGNGDPYGRFWEDVYAEAPDYLRRLKMGLPTRADEMQAKHDAATAAISPLSRKPGGGSGRPGTRERCRHSAACVQVAFCLILRCGHYCCCFLM